jgi:ATP-dependent helicase Lhr and Lhr-like helicase
LFTNSRQLVEQFTNQLTDIAEKQKVSLNFLPHHGSLDPKKKKEAVDAIKDPKQCCVLVCTSTLELGIDIGTITQVGQIDSGSTVASLQQRLGRSGRGHGEISKLFVYIRENYSKDSTSVLSNLHLPTFQALSQIELVKKGIFETHDFRPANLSTVIQQILSFAKQKNEISYDHFRSLLVENGPFISLRKVKDPDDHLRLLFNQLIHNNFLEKVNRQSNHFQLGRKGKEYLDYQKHGFYAAFQSPGDYVVYYNDQALGKIPLSNSFKIGDEIIFSGKLWIITSKRPENRVIRVMPSAKGHAPTFPGDPIPPSQNVISQMLQLYTGKTKIENLHSSVRSFYDEGRKVFKKHNLKSLSIIAESNGLLLFPWVSERKQISLIYALQYWGLKAQPAKIAIYIENSNIDEIILIFKKIVGAKKDKAVVVAEPMLPIPTEAARSADNLIIDKHDRLLSPYLQRWNYATSKIDMESVTDIIKNLLKGM